MTKVLFMGRKPVAAQALNWLCEVKDIMVVAVITDSHLTISPTRNVADEKGLPVISKNDAETMVKKGHLKYDFAVSMLFWQRISKVLIDNAKKGIINFHPAPLPDFKGTAGYNIAVLEGHNKWAVSAHYVDENFDTGDIIDVQWFNIDSDAETALSLERKAQPELFTQFVKVTSKAINSIARLPTSSNVGGRYISRKEMEAMKIVQSDDDIERKIRAFWFPPYDGAYIILNGVKCTLVHRPILNTLADPNSSSLFTSPAA